MSKLILAVPREVIKGIGNNALMPMMCVDQLDRFLSSNCMAVAETDMSPELLRVAVFVAVIHDNAILTAAAHDEIRLGFDAPIALDPAMIGQSMKLHIIYALHRELEINLPQTAYTMMLEGLLYSERDPDRQNLGIFFTVRAGEATNIRPVEGCDGTKTFQWRALQEIDPTGVTRWSAIVLQHCLERCMEVHHV